LTILLAEDSRFMRLALERTLVKAGHTVLSVEDGQRAIRMAQEKSPDLILLDMMLPKLSGPEVLAALKRDPATSRIPVIVLTSLSQKNEEKLRQAGAAAFLLKSEQLLEANSRTLVELVQSLVSESRA
jgi:CheY-like chemotaxis protein